MHSGLFRMLISATFLLDESTSLTVNLEIVLLSGLPKGEGGDAGRLAPFESGCEGICCTVGKLALESKVVWSVCVVD